MPSKKSKSTRAPAVKPRSNEERTLLQKEIAKANEQLESIGTQQRFQQRLFDRFSAELERSGGDIDKQQQIEDAQFQQAMDALGITSDALVRQDEFARSGGRIDEQTEGFIDEIFERQLATGESAIDREVLDALEMVREELAPARGLRSDDTPILDRGFQIASEGQRAKGDLLNTLLANAAAQKLNFPLEQGKLTSANNQFLTNFGLTSANFADQLQQQAFTNRLNLINSTGQLGLGLATGVNSFPGSTAIGLQQGRIASAPTTVSSKEPFDIVGAAGAAGGILSGLGAIGICWVAREVYGIDNPRWLEFRQWLLEQAPAFFRKLYIRHGQRFAAYLHDKPRLKAGIRYLMNKVLGY